MAPSFIAEAAAATPTQTNPPLGSAKTGGRLRTRDCAAIPERHSFRASQAASGVNKTAESAKCAPASSSARAASAPESAPTPAPKLNTA